MIEEIIQILNDSFYENIASLKEKHEAHKTRVKTAILWWDENRISEK